MPSLIRLLIIAVLFYLIIWMIRGLVTPKGGAQPIINGEELVKDALTGIYFPRSKAVVINKDGQKLYFISISNRDQWLSQDGRKT